MQVDHFVDELKDITPEQWAKLGEIARKYELRADVRWWTMGRDGEMVDVTEQVREKTRK